MKRKIDLILSTWRDEEGRPILLLRGARQVGKTYSVRELGKQFEHFLEINLEEERAVHRFFTDSLNPQHINEKLSAYFACPIIPKQTLVFFDEIQACPNALRALRFYHEKNPDLHVIAAGSLLEFALAELPSFGVGRIASLFMYPMSFQEFLWAHGDELLDAQVAEATISNPIDDSLHQRLIERVRLYQVLGGMPAVLNRYFSGHTLHDCQTVIDQLLTGIQDDFAKYKNRSPVAALREVFHAIAKQTGGKFNYSKISPDGFRTAYKTALDLLVQAGLAYKVVHSSAQGIPLGAQANEKKFKVILFDSGIHQRLLGLDLSQQMILEPIEFINKGSLAELFVGLELLVNRSPWIHPELYYWHREAKSSNAELDYLIQKNTEILPIEVKAGTKGQMQSLFLFLKDHHCPIGIRISHENFTAYDRIRTIPIYAVRTLYH